MLVNEKALKDFKKRLKERQNELERSVGEILSQFVGEIRDFGLDLYAQHTIEFDQGKIIFDYALRLKHRDAEDWVFIELKEYEDPGLLVPHITKFGESCAAFESKYRDCGAYRMFVIDTDREALPMNLSQEATKHRVNLVHYSILQMLEEQIEAVGPTHALLEFLKNSFNLSIRYPGQDFFQVEAVRNSYGEVMNYTFSIPAVHLLRLSYVYRAAATGDPKLEEAYQRSVDAKRLPRIRRFIQSDHIGRMFPNNIVANIPIGSSAVIENIDESFARIALPNEYGALWIIDGQHRLLSLARCGEDEWKSLGRYPFLVSAYNGLKNRDQAKLFFAINDEQTGINPNLICYILSRLLEDKEGAAAYVALRLQETELFTKGIYFGVGKRSGRWLNLKTFVDSLCPSQDQKQNLIDYSVENARRGWMQKNSTDIDTPVEILKEYFDVISENFPTDWHAGRQGFCQSNAGIAVWLRILLKIAMRESAWRHFSENWTRKWFTRYVGKCDHRILKRKIPDLDVEEWRGARNESEYNTIAEFLWNQMVDNR